MSTRRRDNSNRSQKEGSGSGRSVMECKYYVWRDTYFPYLLKMHTDMLEILKGYKVIPTKDITFEEFAKFAFLNSSGYLSPYA
jgi:hypothetical protein